MGEIWADKWFGSLRRPSEVRQSLGADGRKHEQVRDAEKEEMKEAEPTSIFRKDPNGKAPRNSNCGTFRCKWMRAEVMVLIQKKEGLRRWR